MKKGNRHAKKEGQAPVLNKLEAELPTDVVESMHIVVERRRDGLWRCEVVTDRDERHGTMPKPEFKHRRLFLREFERMREQLTNLVFRGAIRKV